MSNNKTDFTPYNEDNFVERDGKLQELTVEITLEEYRNLLTERVYNEKQIEALQEKNKHLEESLEVITEMIYENAPQLKGKISSLFETVVQLMKGESTTEGTDEE